MMNDDFILKSLKKLNFQNTTIEDYKKVTEPGFLKKFKKNEYIYMEGDTPEYFYLLIAGKVEINKATDRYNYKIFAALTPGDFFGIPELYLSAHAVNALCLDDSEILLVSKSAFFEKVIRINNFLADLYKQSSRMLAEMQTSICIDTAEHKVISYLYYQMKSSGIQIDKGIYVKKIQSNEKIASVLNITRETLSRILSDLKENGIIEVTRDAILITNPDKLSKMIITDQKFAGFYGTSYQ